MKTKFALIIFVGLLLSSCISEGSKSQGKGYQGQSGQITTELSQAEKDGLLFMWEEEKMARDVYITLSNKYGDQTLSNISQSEQKHMNAVKNLLSQIGMVPPVDENSIGVFFNNEIKNMYAELIQRGEVSISDAWHVGRDIELLDIEDLQSRLSQTADPGIQKVYGNLLNASYKHLDAFNGQ
ncbi:unnamed protein product, partial [Chrysoparadoxa australica]